MGVGTQGAKYEKVDHSGYRNNHGHTHHSCKRKQWFYSTFPSNASRPKEYQNYYRQQLSASHTKQKLHQNPHAQTSLHHCGMRYNWWHSYVLSVHKI